MDSHTQPQQPAPKDAKRETRQAALASLAVVGFIALVIVGITLAIYSARYVPSAVSKLGNVSSLFGNASTTPTLTVEPSTTTIPFATSTEVTTVAMVPSDADTSGNTDVTPAVPAPTVSHKAPSYYGLPDLSVQVLAIGYLAGDTTDTFVATPVIPAGAHPAVKFSVTNIGTNVSAPWVFMANIPSATGPVFNSNVEQSLAPGDHIDFTLGFNQTVPGNQIVSIVVDPNNVIQESNKQNNVTAAGIAVQ